MRVAQAIDVAPKLAKRAKTESKPTPSNVNDIVGDQDHCLSNQAPHQDLFDDPDGDPWFDCEDPDPGDTLSMPCSSSDPFPAPPSSAVQSHEESRSSVQRCRVPKRMNKAQTEQQRVDGLARLVNNLKSRLNRFQ